MMDRHEGTCYKAFFMKAEPTSNDINALDKEEESEAPKKPRKPKAALLAGWHIGH